MVEPVRGVTAENYVTLAAAFIRANGNVGFFIIRDAELAVPEFPCTPKKAEPASAHAANRLRILPP